MSKDLVICGTACSAVAHSPAAGGLSHVLDVGAIASSCATVREEFSRARIRPAGDAYANKGMMHMLLKIDVDFMLLRPLVK